MTKMSKEEFEKAIQRAKEFEKVISQFSNKDECIKYLMRESNLSREECERAYEFHSKLELSDEHIQLAKSILD